MNPNACFRTLAVGFFAANLLFAAPPALPSSPASKPALQSEELTTQAQHLFDAIRKDQAALGADFFFPKEPFIPLKDVAAPEKYWQQLYRTYQQDIHQLHQRNAKELAEAEFVSFTLGSPPSWVKPGEEYNKLGYYRTFNGKLRYRASSGKERIIEVKTIISWENKWYVTHLLPIQHG